MVCVALKQKGHAPKSLLLQQRTQKESTEHGRFRSRAVDEIFAGNRGEGIVRIAGLAPWRDYLAAPAACEKGLELAAR
jgi:hypothetical protein